LKEHIADLEAVRNFFGRTNQDVHWGSAIEEERIDFPRPSENAFMRATTRDNQEIQVAFPVWMTVRVRSKQDDAFGLTLLDDALSDLVQQLVGHRRVPSRSLPQFSFGFFYAI